MAMKKADMLRHREEYQSLMAEARSAEQEGVYRKAVELALSSWDHIDGMMQYERRYANREFANIEGIDVILRYAPLLFDFSSLDALETILKNSRRIEKNTSENLGGKLAKARARMWDAHRLWDHLERHPEVSQDKLSRALGGSRDRWRSITDAWENMALVYRTRDGESHRIALSTRMGRVVPGKCSSCGVVVSAPKAMLLEKLPCPECRATVFFIILSTATTNDTKE